MTDFDEILFKPVNQSELFYKLTKFLHHNITALSKDSDEADIQNLENFPEEILKVLPQIKEALESNILPKYESIKDQLVLFKIEEFANELKKLALSFNFRILIDYADKIFAELEIIDLDELKETLDDFPRVLDMISLLIQKQN